MSLLKSPKPYECLGQGEISILEDSYSGGRGREQAIWDY